MSMATSQSFKFVDFFKTQQSKDLEKKELCFSQMKKSFNKGYNMIKYSFLVELTLKEKSNVMCKFLHGKYLYFY